MKSLKSLALCFGIVAFVFCTSCKNSGKEIQNSDEISTALVNNPHSASKNENSTDKKSAKIAFKNVRYDFGKISQGELVHYKFHFKNTGNAPLIILKSRGSCGCTVPSWPKTPIAPGDSSSLSVVFNSNGKVGQQSIQVTVVANTQPNTTVVAIDGYVMVPGQNPKDIDYK